MYLRLSEDSLKIISVLHMAADADRDLFEAREKDHLRRAAQDPLRSTESHLRPTEDFLSQADGAMNLTERALPPNINTHGQKRTF